MKVYYINAKLEKIPFEYSEYYKDCSFFTVDKQ